MKNLKTSDSFYPLSVMVAALFIFGCKEPYIPPAIKSTPNYLVVDGTLLSGADSSVITLSRTRSLSDSINSSPEWGAQISVLGASGEVYSMFEEGNGRYWIGNLNLNTGENYQLQILTTDGKKYLSDAVPLVSSPPIDSVSWKWNSTGPTNKLGVGVYVSTHDPLNQTKYYRWEYVETYEYQSKIESFYYYAGGQLNARDSTNQIYQCWRTNPSTGLSLATSAALSQDIIFEKPLVFIPQADQKLGVRYSIFVKQYSLTKDAYNYWETLLKNTELTGSIFDPQPSQGLGNIHCLTNPAEPVLGYFSASTSQQQRIFINYNQIIGWGFVTVPAQGCTQIATPPDSFAYYFGSLGYIPTSPKGISDFYGTYAPCTDCTLQGGINVKPSFW